MAESEYRQALVTYIDILGFKKMVEDSERDSARIPELRFVLKTLRNQIGTGRRFKREIPESSPSTPIFRAFSFSDLTVRATVIDPADEFLNIFMGELCTLVNEQCRLVCRDDGNSPILLRGGISLGLLQVHPEIQEDELIFGPALVRAYELESTAAIFPRIVIDPAAIRKASSATTGHFYKQLISQSEDGVYFVDYLNACEEYSYTNALVFGGGGMSFTTHKHMIETQLAKLKASGAREGTIQKYLWLANYHNLKASQLPDPEFEPPVFEGDASDAEMEEAHRLRREELYISEELLNLLKQ
jgi:hypothetical protein